MNTPTHQKLLNVCVEAARRAGTYALDNIHRREEFIEQFDHDIKLVMDRESQTLAEEVVHSHFPDHAILGEEGASTQKHAFEWIIDPIDGTANYTRGLPTWCCSVAVRHKGDMLAGCIYVPVVDECYIATVDGPPCSTTNRSGFPGFQPLGKPPISAGSPKTLIRGRSTCSASWLQK